MRFVLLAPIHLSQDPRETIPAGATGTISRGVVPHYTQLVFDHAHTKQLQYWDNILVLDNHDTDPEIFDKISPLFDSGVKACHISTRSIQELVT